MALRQRPCVADEREQHPARYMVPDLRRETIETACSTKVCYLNLTVVEPNSPGRDSLRAITS